MKIRYRGKILVFLFFLILLIIIYFKFFNFDYKMTTSVLTSSGLINDEMIVVGKDIEEGDYKICSGINYIDYSVKNYDKEEYSDYKENGLYYEEEVLYSNHLNSHSCEQISLQKGTVLEAFNNDWGKVDYYLKKEI